MVKDLNGSANLELRFSMFFFSTFAFWLLFPFALSQDQLTTTTVDSEIFQLENSTATPDSNSTIGATELPEEDKRKWFIPLIASLSVACVIGIGVMVLMWLCCSTKKPVKKSGTESTRSQKQRTPAQSKPKSKIGQKLKLLFEVKKGNNGSKHQKLETEPQIMEVGRSSVPETGNTSHEPTPIGTGPTPNGHQRAPFEVTNRHDPLPPISAGNMNLSTQRKTPSNEIYLGGNHED